MSTEQPYRAAPVERPIVAVHEITEPFLPGRVLACFALLAGLASAMFPQASELTCRTVHAQTVCVVTDHGGLRDRTFTLPSAHFEGFYTSPLADLSVSRIPGLVATQSDPGQIPLPARGMYRVNDENWRDDDRVAASANAWRQQPDRRTFQIREPGGGLGLGLSLLLPCLGLALLGFSERKTRWLRVSLDPNLRTVRGRSHGLGGPSMDRTYTFGASPELKRFDDPGGSGLPMLRVVSAEGTTLPVLTGHAHSHRAAFNRLIARANDALTRGTAAPPSPSWPRRVLPTAALALALGGLFTQVVGRWVGVPTTTGTIEMRAPEGRCETGGMTLLRGAVMAWSAPIGRAVQQITVAVPSHRDRYVTVEVDVNPGERTVVDCGRLRDLQCVGDHQRVADPRGLRCAPTE